MYEFDFSLTTKTGGKLATDLLEKYATQQSPSRIEDLVKIFIHATKASQLCPVPLAPRAAYSWIRTDLVHNLPNRWRLASGTCSPTSDSLALLDLPLVGTVEVLPRKQESRESREGRNVGD